MVNKCILHCVRTFVIGKSRKSRYWTLVICLVVVNLLLICFGGSWEWNILSSLRPKQIKSHVAYRYNGEAGFQTAKQARERCEHMHKLVPQKEEKFWLTRMHTMSKYRHLYCPVEKTGTTFWRRVLYIMTQPNHTFNQPYQVPIYDALVQKFEPITLRHGAGFGDYFKFLFVRNPYSRVLSAYIDKVFVPNPTFWERFGVPAINMFRKEPSEQSASCGHDPTFAEFVRFVIHAEKSGEKRDLHFMKISDMCMPCIMNFTFVGKMEHFAQDVFFVLQNLGLYESIEVLERDLTKYQTDDAITDSIVSPFSWRKDIESCMNWDEALRRIWRKLQLRGFISFQQKFPLTTTQSMEVTQTQFISLARQAQKASRNDDLRSQKNSVFKQLYMTIPSEDLVNLRKVFKVDFNLFGYDDTPPVLFQRNILDTVHDYLNTNKDVFNSMPH